MANEKVGPNHRIKIKIGTSEFEAEGPVDIVNKQYQSFLDTISSVGSLLSHTEAPPSNPSGGEPQTPGAKPENVPSITQDTLNRIYRQHRDLISLAALPENDKSGADALILLLYGYRELKDIEHVTGSLLMKSAKQSGVRILRVDRVLDSRKEYILAGGNRRGKRYGLNNRGMSYAQDLIHDLS